MKNKPKIIGKSTVFIDKTVKFGKNVTVHPGNIIEGDTIIGDNVTLYPNNYISSSTIKNNAEIRYSYIENATVGENAQIGPYSRLRPNAVIGKNCKVGNFVEVKNSTLGDGTKASHLAYIGDSEVGRDCNIGCGAIFVNYNGKEKNRSVVGDRCFVGSNVNMIAPLNIADDTYICAGTTVTQDTNAMDFVIGRCREVVKPQYAKKYKKENK